MVTGVDAVIRLASDGARRAANGARYRLLEVVGRDGGAISIFEDARHTDGRPPTRHVGVWEFRGGRISSLRVYVPGDGDDAGDDDAES